MRKIWTLVTCQPFLGWHACISVSFHIGSFSSYTGGGGYHCERKSEHGEQHGLPCSGRSDPLDGQQDKKIDGKQSGYLTGGCRNGLKDLGITLLGSRLIILLIAGVANYRDSLFFRCGQVVLCGAGMDARAYRMPMLKGCNVFELDIKPVLDYKARTLEKVRNHKASTARVEGFL